MIKSLFPGAAQPDGQDAADGLALLQSEVHREALGNMPVTTLMTWFLDRRNLEAAWQRVSAADGADTPGPDGATCSGLRGQVGPWLSRLADELFRGQFRPAPPRWIEVAKPDKPAF